MTQIQMMTLTLDKVSALVSKRATLPQGTGNRRVDTDKFFAEDTAQVLTIFPC